MSLNSLSLREAPNEKSREISSLSRGTSLLDLDEVSQHETQIVIGGQLFQSPWIKVETSKHQIGWVLASGLGAASSQKDWLLQKRIRCYFGRDLTEKRNALMLQLDSVQTELQMRENWRNSQHLRDTFATLLARRAEFGFQPDFDWLSTALPGYIYQQMEHDPLGQLYADFQFWQGMSLKTKGIQDDQFFQTCFVAFSADSIESIYPAWTFQYAETAAANQLGIGKHTQVLLQIDKALESGNLFRKELEVFKEKVLDDIFGKKVAYWQPREKILAELSALIQNPPKCLQAAEIDALQIRMKMFENPELNGIKVNLRSGE